MMISSELCISPDKIQEYLLCCEITQSHSHSNGMTKMRKCELYFEKFKKSPDALKICIFVFSQVNVHSETTILFSSQLFRQICMSKGCPTIDDAIVSSLTDSILYYSQNVKPIGHATVIQMLLGLASILTKKIITSGATLSLKSIVQRLLNVNNLPRKLVVDLLGMIPENIHIKHYHKRCTSTELMIEIQNVYGYLLRDVCDILNVLVEKDVRDCNSDKISMLCISNWMQTGLSTFDSDSENVAQSKVFSIPFITAAVKGFLSYELTAHALRMLDIKFSHQNSSDMGEISLFIDYIGTFCEVSAVVSHEIGLSLAVHLLPMIAKWLKHQLDVTLSSKVELSKLDDSSVFCAILMCVSSWAVPLVPVSVGRTDLWRELLSLLISVLDSANLEVLTRYEYLEQLYGLLGVVVTEVPADSLLFVEYEDIYLQMIESFVRCSQYVCESESEVREEFSGNRMQLRVLIRDVSLCCPEMKYWLLQKAIHFASQNDSNSNWKVIESWLHAVSSITKHFESVSDNTWVVALLSSLSRVEFYVHRVVCRMLVVIIGELVSLSWRFLDPANSHVHLAMVLLTTLHAEIAETSAGSINHAIDFRTKQDHIGIVTVLKLAKLDLYQATPLVVTNDAPSPLLPYSELAEIFHGNLLTVMSSIASHPKFSLVGGTVECGKDRSSLFRLLVSTTYYGATLPPHTLATWKSFNILAQALGESCVGSPVYTVDLKVVVEAVSPFFVSCVITTDENKISNFLSDHVGESIVVISLEIGRAISVAHSKLECFEVVSTVVKSVTVKWFTTGPDTLSISLMFSAFVVKWATLIKLDSEDECRIMCSILVDSLVKYNPEYVLSDDILNTVYARYCDILNFIMLLHQTQCWNGIVIAAFQNWVLRLSTWKEVVDISSILLSGYRAFCVSLNELCALETNAQHSMLALWVEIMMLTDWQGRSGMGLVKKEQLGLETVLGMIRQLHATLLKDYLCSVNRINNLASSVAVYFCVENSAIDKWQLVGKLVYTWLGRGCSILDDTTVTFPWSILGQDTAVDMTEGKGEEWWTHALRVSGQAHNLLLIIYMAMLHSIPGYCKDIAVKLLIKFYVQFGARASSELSADCYGAMPTLFACDKMKYNQYLSSLSASISGASGCNWDKFRSVIKAFCRSNGGKCK